MSASYLLDFWGRSAVSVRELEGHELVLDVVSIFDLNLLERSARCTNAIIAEG